MASCGVFRVPCSASGPFEDVFEFVQVVVREDAEFGTGQAGAVHERSVDQFVQDDNVVFAEEGADGAQGGGVTGGKTDGSLRAFEAGNGLLQFLVRGE